MLSNVETRYQPQFGPDKKNLRGKTVVILGDSYGIGCATAAILAEKGARIFFAARTSTELNTVFATLAREGGQWDGSVVDIQQPGGLRRLFDLVVRRLGKIDVFIHLLPAGDSDTNQQMFREAIRHIGRGARIIQVGLGEITKNAPAGEPGRLAHQRQEAQSQGIHLTRIEPGLADYRNLAYNKDLLNAVDVAQTISESLAQSFEIDVVYLPGKFNSHSI